MVTAADVNAGLALAEAIYGAVHATARPGQPRTWWQIPAKALDGNDAVAADSTMPEGWRVNWIVLLQPPGVIGWDERGRWNVVFNFDVTFEPA